MRFWDSCALVALAVPQTLSSAVEHLIAADPEVVVWWGTQVECVSALTRLAREGRLDEDHVSTAKRRLDAILDRSDTIEPSHGVRDRACRLLRAHPLRAGDALQLAAAMELRGDRSDAVEFVTFDSRLAVAARREDFLTPEAT